MPDFIMIWTLRQWHAVFMTATNSLYLFKPLGSMSESVDAVDRVCAQEIQIWEALLGVCKIYVNWIIWINWIIKDQMHTKKKDHSSTK
jgi:hypothetical protein